MNVPTADNSWKSIYNHLKSNGYSVFSPGQHVGKCESLYVVLAKAPTTKRYCVEDRLYDILIYIPLNDYSTIEDALQHLKFTMNKLFPFVQMYEDSSEPYLDKDVAAYMTSIMYRAPQVSNFNNDII